MNPRYSAVAARAGHRCEYCHAPEVVFNLQFEVEHILPPGAGGDDDMADLALACRSCNLFKSNCTELVDSSTMQITRLFHPRLDRWDEHFRVLESGQVEGQSGYGRVIVVQLNTNAASQIAARLHWMRLGMYPS